MDYASVLAVLVKVDGVTKAAAQVEAFDATMQKAGKSSGQASGGVDSMTASAQKAGVEIESAQKQTDLWTDANGRLRNSTGQFATAADKARASIRGVGDDLEGVRNSTKGVGDELERVYPTITQVNNGFSQSKQTIANASDELRKHGQISSSTRSDLENLGARGVQGVDRDLTKMTGTLERAEKELDSTGTLSRRTERDLQNLGSSGSGAGGGLGSLVAALGASGAGLSGFGLAAIAAVPIVASLVGVAFALVSALGPLVGVAAAGGAGLLALAQGAGVLKLATSGIGAALKEQTTGQAAAGKSAVASAGQQRAAAEAITSATEQLGQAQQQAAQAEKAVTVARTQAARALVDMRQGLNDAVTAEQQATFGLKDAKQALADLTAGASSRDLADATQTVTEAIHGQQGAVLALTDAQQTYQSLVAGASQHQLAEGAQQVTDAYHSQQAAVLALTDAEDAFQQLTKSADPQSVAEGQQSVTDAQTGQESAAVALTKAQENYQTVLQSGTSTDLEKRDALVQLHEAQDNVKDSANRLIDAQTALTKLQTPASQQDIAKATLAIQQAQDAVADATNNTTDAQTALTKLQTPASQQDLAKALLAVEQAQDGVTDAATATTAAETALHKLQSPASQEDVAKATLAVRDAQNQLAESTTARLRQQKDLAAADRAGISGSQQVVAAQQAVAQADRSVRDAARSLHDAQLAASDSADKQTIGAQNLSKAMDSLPAPAQAFVRQLISLKPKLDDLRATAAAGFFPGASKGLSDAVQNFEPVKKVVDETATALGGVTEKAGELVGSKGFGKDLETVGGRNAKVISILGDAALHVVDALRNVIVVAGPLETWLAKTADGWARNVDEASAAGRENGKLAGFFDRTRTVLTRLGLTIEHTVSGLLGMGHASKSSGDDMLHSIEKASLRFDKWANSVDGQKSLKKFFDDAKGFIGDLIPVLKGVASATASLGFGPMATALKIAGPHAKDLAEAFLSYKVAATAAAIATKVLTPAMAALDVEMDANPVGAVVLGLTALGAALIYVYLHSKTFRDIVGDAFTGLKIVIAPILDWLKDGVAGLVSWISDHWDTIKHDTQVAWNFVHDHIVNPVGDAISWIKTAITNVISWLVGAWGTIRSGVTEAWNVVHDHIVNPVASAFDDVKTAVGAVTSWLAGAWNTIRSGVTDAWSAVRDHIVNPVGDAISKIKDALGAVGGWLINNVWQPIRAGVTDAWGAIHDHIVNPISDAVSAIGDLFTGKKGLVGVLKSIWGTIKDDAVAGWLLFSNAAARAWGAIANVVIGFVNDIIDAINWVLDKIGAGKIGKIDKVSIPKGLSPGDAQKQAAGFAQGGITSGGLVKAPLIMMGEEAPRHPEFVIPTNPAYRDRAVGLLGQAAKAIGYATGGVLSFGQIENTWTAAGGNPKAANTMGWIAEAESSGNPNALNPSGASGLWQILGQPVPGNIFNPHVNALNAIAKSSNGQNLHPWDASRSVWEKHVLSGAGGVVSGPAGAVASAAGSFLSHGLDWIMDKFKGLLPDPKGLPDWLSGAAPFLFDKATGWVKDKVEHAIKAASSTVTGLGGAVQGVINKGGTPGGTQGPNGVGSFNGIPMADWVIQSLRHAQTKGVAVRPTSGYRPGFDPHTVTGVSEHSGTQYPHGAVDFGGFVDPVAKVMKLAVVQATQDFKWPLLAPIGFSDDGHASGTGHAIGGLISKAGTLGGLPFGGYFGAGGVIPGAPGEPVVIVGHGGETVSPAGLSAQDAAARVADALASMAIQVFVGDTEISDIVDVRIAQRDRGATAGFRAGVLPG